MGYRVKNISPDHISINGANLAPGESKIVAMKTAMISYLAKNNTVSISSDAEQETAVVAEIIESESKPKQKAKKVESVEPDAPKGDS